MFYAYFLLAYLEAFAPADWLTIGLVVFAGAQIWVTNGIARRDAEARQEEATRQASIRETEAAHAETLRIAAAEERSDADYQLVWAEQFRFESLAQDWRRLDLVMESAAQALDPALLLPADWPSVASALARLSRESAYLGAMAITHAHDTARMLARLNNMMRIYRERHPSLTPDDLAVRARREVPLLAEFEESIKDSLAELPLLYWDALLHSPRASVPRKLHFRDTGLSKIGQEAVAAISNRSTASPPASSENAG